MSVGMRMLTRCVGVMGLLAALACGQSAGDVEFADHVWHQTRQVTTDLVSVHDGIGLDHVGFGWRAVAGNDGPSHLEMAAEPARVSFFSADGDATALVLRMRRAGATSYERVRVRVRLNQAPLGRIETSEEWREVRLELPRGTVRTGWNVLEFELRGRDTKALREQTFDLASVRIETASNRSIWMDRPETIEIAGAGEGRAARVLMPSPSWLEVFAAPTSRSQLEAGLAARARPTSDDRPVEVYATLFDGSSEVELFRQVLVPNDATESGRIEVDLGNWAGTSVRVKLGASGPGNAVVEWHEARISRAGDALDEEAPLITRRAVESTSRLGRPHVVVIMLDAARADAFSPFGGGSKTPSVERLAAGGSVFEQAFSASSWTGQSVAAFMTGLYPDSIGVGAWGSTLAGDVSTLAQLMSANGYRTIGWTHHPFYGVQTSMKRGFDHFSSVRKEPYRVPRVEELFRSADEPTFAFVHLMPPHAPYDPPAPFRGLYTASDVERLDVEARALNRYSRSVGEGEVDPADLDYVRARYLENVAYADSLVGELVGDLETHGLYDEALVILVSDHGEAFYEHGEFLHTKSLFREMLHVPLVLKWPASVRGFTPRIEGAVSLVDLMPTLVDGLGLAGGEQGFQGRSLLPTVFDGEAREPGIYAVTRGVASGGRAPQPWRALLVDGWKILQDELAATTRLFDVASDPLESRDRAQEEPLRASLLERALERQAEYNRQLAGASGPRSDLEPMPADVRKQLEALGYLN